ncbi:MAG: fatty acid desaturase [Bacteriovoracaceae bacterium]
MKFYSLKVRTPFILLFAYVLLTTIVYAAFGPTGFFGEFWQNYTFLKIAIYVCAMTHITISCMSLSFHRHHTHKGVVFNKFVDTLMQLWLWLVTSMCKLDWVSVHQYHHLHSDTEEDPHSPVVKGLRHVLFMGVFDYTKAKDHPEVLKLRARIKYNKLEKFISENLFLGPSLAVGFNILLFGVFWGSMLSVINFLISPIFAVGGVNAIAHWWGYRNHQSNDNSRNVGFLFPLNFLICGELDHNNHHAHQRSCSFRHKWYEFDIGYFYIKVLKRVKLAEVKSVYNTRTFKQDLARKAQKLMDYEVVFKDKCEKLSLELKQDLTELQEQIRAYMEGKKVKLDRRVQELALEIKMHLRAQNQFVLTQALH